jgi:hypothetical protein
VSYTTFDSSFKILFTQTWSSKWQQERRHGRRACKRPYVHVFYRVSNAAEDRASLSVDKIFEQLIIAFSIGVIVIGSKENNSDFLK